MVSKFICLWLSGILSMGQLNTDNEKNIPLIKNLALKVYSGNQILADLTTAQAILESNLLGRVPSSLAYKYNNLFGIKGRGTKGSVTLNTKEFIHGQFKTVSSTFAWNASIEDSLIQRKALLENGTRDKPDRYHNVLSAKTFEEAAQNIQKDGYATDPTYSKQLIDIYNKYLK